MSVQDKTKVRAVQGQDYSCFSEPWGGGQGPGQGTRGGAAWGDTLCAEATLLRSLACLQVSSPRTGELGPTLELPNSMGIGLHLL